MRGITPLIAALLLVTQPVAAADDARFKDPYFGEAFYYALQGEHFDAIARLDTELKQYYGVDEPQLDTLNFHINEAEFSVGDFELSYRMHGRASRAIKAVIEGNVPPAVRNEAIYRLARIYFQKEQNVNALHTIERIEGKVPESIVNDVAFLKGQIFMVNGRFSEAEKIFTKLLGEKSHEGFAGYNLGVSLFAQGKDAEGIVQLDRAGQVGGSDRAVQAIRDKSNLVLGSRLLEKGELQRAAIYFERVRLDGPFSNRALLGMGWAEAKLEKFDRALVPWSILFKRNVTDPSVQEALLGVPYAYGKLGLHGKAALLYNSALGSIGGELDKLDASIKSINEGNFLKALVREEIKQDKGWVIKLREMADTPETYYLMDLMASHDFQSMLQNYLDLEQLRKRLDTWGENYNAFEEIIALRRQYYEPLLPSLDERFRKLDARIRLRLEQRDKLDTRLRAMLVAPRPDFLATAQERIAREAITRLEKRLGKNNPETNRRIARLRGRLLWDIHTQYDERLTEAFTNLAALDADITRLKTIHNSFVRTRQAATQSYQGYDKPIQRLRIKTENAREKVRVLMTRQGHMLEVMAVNELRKRREKLEVAQVKARFAMAESYDRATLKAKQAEEAQAQEEAAKQQETLPQAPAEEAPSTPEVAPAQEEKPAQGDTPAQDTDKEKAE